MSNVSKDGVGGVTSCGQGSLWRVDALRGMAADGTQSCDSEKSPDIIGHDCGFRSEVLIEDTHTSLEFFKLQWRSAYVCEPGETLAVCVEQPNTVAWRVKQVGGWGYEFCACGNWMSVSLSTVTSWLRCSISSYSSVSVFSVVGGRAALTPSPDELTPSTTPQLSFDMSPSPPLLRGPAAAATPR